MKFTQPISLILTATLSLAAAEPAKKPHTLDDSQAHVLQSDWLDLARELGDESEAGQDEAARLQAAAKRIQTESRVAGKSMRRVIILNEWRETLNRWEDLQLELVCLWNGGGTLYHHMMAPTLSRPRNSWQPLPTICLSPRNP